MNKSSKALKPAIYRTFLAFLGITIILNTILACIWDMSVGMGGIGIVFLYLILIIPTGITTLILALYIIYKAANNKELRKYAIICKYALLAAIVAAIILCVSHTVITGKGIDYQTIKKIQGSAFVTYLCINIIGIIHTIIIFVKNRNK